MSSLNVKGNKYCRCFLNAQYQGKFNLSEIMDSLVTRIGGLRAIIMHTWKYMWIYSYHNLVKLYILFTYLYELYEEQKSYCKLKELFLEIMYSCVQNVCIHDFFALEILFCVLSILLLLLFYFLGIFSLLVTRVLHIFRIFWKGSFCWIYVPSCFGMHKENYLIMLIKWNRTKSLTLLVREERREY